MQCKALLLTGCLLLPAQCHRPKERDLTNRYKGAALAHVHMPGKGYGTLRDRSIYAHLKSLGINAIQFNPFVYQRSPEEPEFSWDDPTLTQQNLRAEIRYAKAQGFRVMLAPHLWPGGGHPPSVWRSQIDYADVKKRAQWFGGYAKFILEQAQIARDEKVDVFAVGVELEALTRHEAEWRALIRAVKSTGLKSALTYECEAWNAANIRFWDALDFVGLNFYYAYPHAFNADSASDRASLLAFYKEKLLQHEKHARLVGKPLLFAELGFPGHEHAITQTAGWTNRTQKRSDKVQRLGFSTMREAFKSIDYHAGVFFWKYVTTLDSYEKRSYDTDFILQGKPAETVIKSWN